MRLAKGDTPQQIIDDYTQEYGTAALAIPPDKGAMKAIYVAPLFAIAGAGVALAVLLRRWRANESSAKRRSDDAKTGNDVDAKARDAYDDRIDSELEELDNG